MSFPRFDPAAFLAGDGKTFAGFATFAGAQAQSPNSEGATPSLRPSYLAAKIRDREPKAAKVAKVAKVGSPILSAADLHDRYLRRAAIVQFDGSEDHTRAEARAWNEVAGIWHLQHGRRSPAHLCAGCGKPIGGEPDLILLPHGERAHATDDYRCIIAYGRRWKRDAAAALLAFAIPTPRDIAAEIGISIEVATALRNNPPI